MKIEYQNGVRITQFVHEMTPLEAMIQNYEQMAKKHYRRSGSNTLNDKKRIEERDKALKHLQEERAKIHTLIDIQAQLETYREKGLDSTRGSLKQRTEALTMMETEKHHPTGTLEKYMRAEGVPKPSPQHTAHHIVPGKGKLKVLTARTRMHLHTHGIRINDPANGVYLVHKDEDTPHWSMPDSRGHLKYHTHDYERWLARRIQRFNDMDVIKTQLQVVGNLLQQHEPKTAIAAIGKR